MKILTIFTGGTIGCIQAENYTFQSTENTADMLINRYQKSRESQVKFTQKIPFFSPSEAQTPSELTALLECIEKNLTKHHQGILITHGTDTMAYTASALAFSLAHLNIPVVLTGANYPIDDRRSNGYRNFVNSVEFIESSAQSQQKPGIFVVYENNHDRRTLVHLGARLLEAEAFNDEFSSLGGIHYGEMMEGQFHRFDDRINPSNAELKSHRPQTLKKNALAFCEDILFLSPYPGLRYDLYQPLIENKTIKAVVHAMHHSGTACIRQEKGSPYCLRQFMAKCAKQKIPVYSCPSREKLMVETHITAPELIKAGIIPLENISLPAALMKVMLAYGNFKTEQAIQKFLHTEINFEFVDFRRAGYGRHRRQR